MHAFPFPRRPMIALVILGVIIIVGSFIAPRRSRAEAPSTAPSTDIARLRQERIDTLQQASDDVHRLLNQGKIGDDEVFPIDRLLLEAKLEAATSVNDRVRLLSNALELARKREAQAAELYQAGQGGFIECLKAKADRLNVEIRLAELKSK